MGHFKTTQKKKQCIICFRMWDGKKARMETTVQCSKCGVHLCTRKKILPNGNMAKMTCWDRHHTRVRLEMFEFAPRKNGIACPPTNEAKDDDSDKGWWR